MARLSAWSIEMNLIRGCGNALAMRVPQWCPASLNHSSIKKSLVSLTYQTKDENPRSVTVTARSVLGADGARSAVARATIPDAEKTPWVLAYHEIIEVPEDQNWDAYDPDRCDVWYQGRLSPDFYAWVFPHGKNASIGVGSAHKDFSAKASVAALVPMWD